MSVDARSLFLRACRRALLAIEKRLSARPSSAALPLNDLAAEHIRQSLQSIDTTARGYLELHLDRLIHTLQIVPRATRAGSEVLEIGAYGHFAHILQSELGYKPRGAYLGSAGRVDHVEITSRGKVLADVLIDIFNAELDRWPYEDGRFEGVLICEVIEHLIRDPMWLLFEANRVLRPGGWLLITTPNCASYRSLERALLKLENPQVFSRYNSADPAEPPHVREYSVPELHRALEAAGFAVIGTETEREPGAVTPGWVADIIASHQLPAAHRGEQIYCLAKRRGEPRERYPAFLYTS